MNRLYHLVTNNLKSYRYQSIEAIKNELTFDASNFNLSNDNINPLPVVTVSLQGGKKHRETAVAGLTFLWDRVGTNRMIKIKHTKNYKRKLRSNKLEYSTADGVYCTTRGVRVPF